MRRRILPFLLAALILAACAAQAQDQAQGREPDQDSSRPCEFAPPAELPGVGPVEVMREARYGGMLRLQDHPSDMDLLAVALRGKDRIDAILDPNAPPAEAAPETFLAVLACRDGSWAVEAVVALAPYELSGFYYDPDVGSLLIAVQGFEEYLGSLDWDEAEFSLELNPEFPENVAAAMAPMQ